MNIFHDQYPFTGDFFINKKSTIINDLDTTKFYNNFVFVTDSSLSFTQNTDHDIPWEIKCTPVA